MADRGYDVIIVGGGHNGPTCGCYLAKAGQRVLVLEARDVVGGGCATKEVAAPGFRHNFHSNFHGVIHMGPVYRDLEPNVMARPTSGPRTSSPTSSRTAGPWCLARSRQHGGAGCAILQARRRHVSRDRPRLPRPAAGRVRPGDVCAARTTFRRHRAARGDDRWPGLIRQFLTAPNHVARELFESSEVQTWIGFWVAQLAGTGDVFGLGANYPIMVAGSMHPVRVGRGKGGSIRLAQAMANFLGDHGGEIRLDSPVARISVDGLGARSVHLEDGTVIPVDGILVSNLDPKHTFLDLVGEDSLDQTRFPPAGDGDTTRCPCSASTSRSTRQALEGGRHRAGCPAMLRGLDLRVARRLG